MIGLLGDVALMWVRPWHVSRRRLRNPSEPKSFALLLAACVAVFVAQLPRLQQAAATNPIATDQVKGEDVTYYTIAQLVSYEAYAWLLVWPLFFYALAAILHFVARLFGPRISFASSRYAVFWAFFAAAPAVLAMGVVQALRAPEHIEHGVGVIWLAAFAVFVMTGLAATRASQELTL